jgi:hypothetical protein
VQGQALLASQTVEHSDHGLDELAQISPFGAEGQASRLYAGVLAFTPISGRNRQWPYGLSLY